MKEFKKILFPVDLSDVAPKIVPFVRAMAEKFDATIHPWSSPTFLPIANKIVPRDDR